MKFIAFCSTMVIATMSASLFAQEHSDVEFGYNDLANPSSFIFDADDVTSEGILFFESGMEELDPANPGDFSSDEPGFATNLAEGLMVNAGDQIWLNTLDASAHSAFGLGYVNYFNPMTNSLESIGRMGVYDNSASTPDLIFNGNSIESGLNPQFLGLGDMDGDVHDHFIVDLLDDGTAPLGAYGMMFQLQSDFAVGDGTMDLSSEPFWIVWNHGMDEGDFDERALAAFGVNSIPEPSSACLLGLGLASLIVRRRRNA